MTAADIIRNRCGSLEALSSNSKGENNMPSVSVAITNETMLTLDVRDVALTRCTSLQDVIKTGTAIGQRTIADMFDLRGSYPYSGIITLRAYLQPVVDFYFKFNVDSWNGKYAVGVDSSDSTAGLTFDNAADEDDQGNLFALFTIR
jgi:hypothetical protein